MSTTVIIIRGNESQSLLNKIADAISEKNEQKKQDATKVLKALVSANEAPFTLKNVRAKAPYTKTYHFDNAQERIVGRFIKRNKVFQFNTLKAHMIAAGYSKVYNRDLAFCLQKMNVVRFTDTLNRTYWTSNNNVSVK